jgi:uncharacterized membrane-anchored protein
VNWLIIGKEKHLAEGKIVYLNLAPVDPRSLMQGDYMALRFQLTDNLSQALMKKNDRDRSAGYLIAADDYVVVSLDEHNIGTFKDIYTAQPLARNELLLHYRVRGGEVKLATNGFFFQEGHREYYEPARFGQFRVDDKGELLLTAMYDKDLNLLGPPEKQE